MSTKNLARTVIEGGRYRRNRWERRYSNRQERCAEQQLSHLLLRTDFDDVVYTRRPTVYRAFRDKLNPAERWLQSQVGRPWDKVFAELMARFDTRTTAGRHIVFCHLLPSVRVNGHSGRFRRFEFEVDRHGILREVSYGGYTGFTRYQEPDPGTDDWLQGRRVGARGDQLYWFIPTEAGAFRQAARLDEADARRWRSLPRWYREKCDALAGRHAETD